MTTNNPTAITHSVSKKPQNMTMLSAWISRAMGTMTKLASRLAARTLVVWLEMTTAPETITIAAMMLSTKIWINNSRGGA